MEELRRELEHRPLILVAVALCIGLTAILHPLNLLGLLLLLVARRPMPVAIGFLAGLILTPRPVPLLAQPTWVRGDALVLNVPYRTDQGISADLAIADRKLRATFPSGTEISRGETWNLQGNAKPLSEISEGLRFQGIGGTIKSLGAVKQADGPAPWRWTDTWRRSFEAFTRRYLGDENARWLNAFAFRIYDLDQEEMDALKGTGTIHLIAASGIHVAALGLLGIKLGQLFGAPRKAVLTAMTLGLIAYAMATGLHLPTIRAVLAFAVGSSAYLFAREPDSLSALALAVLVYLPFDPAQVYGIGFQLSVTVVGFLVLRPHRHLEEKIRTAPAYLLRQASDFLVISVVATLAAEPILALHEGTITLLTIPSNVLVVPLVMVSITLGFILYFLHLGTAMTAVGGLVSASRQVILWADAVPHSTLNVVPFSPYLLVPYYAAWIYWWRPRARPCD